MFGQNTAQSKLHFSYASDTCVHICRHTGRAPARYEREEEHTLESFNQAAARVAQKSVHLSRVNQAAARVAQKSVHLSRSIRPQPELHRKAHT